MNETAKKVYPKSEFYWGFFSSLIVALGLAVYQYSAGIKNLGLKDNLDDSAKASAFTFSLLPFLGIYFIVGVIMLFNKKSESFAKGLLLSALIILGVMILIGFGIIAI